MTKRKKTNTKNVTLVIYRTALIRKHGDDESSDCKQDKR